MKKFLQTFSKWSFGIWGGILFVVLSISIMFTPFMAGLGFAGLAFAFIFLSPPMLLFWFLVGFSIGLMIHRYLSLKYDLFEKYEIVLESKPRLSAKLPRTLFISGLIGVFVGLVFIVPAFIFHLGIILAVAGAILLITRSWNEPVAESGLQPNLTPASKVSLKVAVVFILLFIVFVVVFVWIELKKADFISEEGYKLQESIWKEEPGTITVDEEDKTAGDIIKDGIFISERFGFQLTLPEGWLVEYYILKWPDYQAPHFYSSETKEQERLSRQEGLADFSLGIYFADDGANNIYEDRGSKVINGLEWRITVSSGWVGVLTYETRIGDRVYAFYEHGEGDSEGYSKEIETLLATFQAL